MTDPDSCSQVPSDCVTRSWGRFSVTCDGRGVIAGGSDQFPSDRWGIQYMFLPSDVRTQYSVCPPTSCVVAW